MRELAQMITNHFSPCYQTHLNWGSDVFEAMQFMGLYLLLGDVEIATFNRQKNGDGEDRRETDSARLHHGLLLLSPCFSLDGSEGEWRLPSPPSSLIYDINRSTNGLRGETSVG